LALSLQEGARGIAVRHKTTNKSSHQRTVVLNSDANSKPELTCPACGRPMKFELEIPIMDGTGAYYRYYSCPAGHVHTKRASAPGDAAVPVL
jgi:hypothetical protein